MYLKIVVIIMLVTKRKTEIVLQLFYFCFSCGIFLFFYQEIHYTSEYLLEVITGCGLTGCMTDVQNFFLTFLGECKLGIKLSKDNNWTYKWTDLTDEYSWSVDEKTVPEGYTKNVTNTGNDFTITNTRVFKNVDVSVEKVWYGANVNHPASVEVILYRDGEAFDTVKLDASNGWKYVWKDLTNEFIWTVDEPSVPSGYTKEVKDLGGNVFQNINTHEDIPKTGDFTNFGGLAMMGITGIFGFLITTFFLLNPRKKGKYQR